MTDVETKTLGELSDFFKKEQDAIYCGKRFVEGKNDPWELLQELSRQEWVRKEDFQKLKEEYSELSDSATELFKSEQKYQSKTREMEEKVEEFREWLFQKDPAYPDQPHWVIHRDFEEVAKKFVEVFGK